MINGAGNTDLPLVFVGDFNAVANSGLDPTFATYQRFINAGFVEAWPAKRHPDPGLTCCQAANLMNPTSQLTTRVDLVLLKGNIQVLDIRRVGEQPGDRTASGALALRPRRRDRDAEDPQGEWPTSLSEARAWHDARRERRSWPVHGSSRIVASALPG